MNNPERLTIRALQGRAINNKRRRGFSTNTGWQIERMVEELGELSVARRKGLMLDQEDACADLIILCLGYLATVDCDAEELLEKVMTEVESR